MRYIVVRVFLDGKLFGIRVIARIYPHHFHPFRRLHRGLRLQNECPRRSAHGNRAAQFRDDVLQVRRVLTVGAVIRTIWQPTATRSSVCCTLVFVSIVSQVIMIAAPPDAFSANDDAATRRIAHHDFTGFPAIKNTGSRNTAYQMNSVRPISERNTVHFFGAKNHRLLTVRFRSALRTQSPVS